MSIKVTNVYTRPSTAVNFHVSNVPDSHIQHVLETYKNPGKVVDVTTDLSDDGLTLTIVWIWVDQASVNEYDADPVIVAFKESSSEYNQSNGITRTTTSEEVA